MVGETTTEGEDQAALEGDLPPPRVFWEAVLRRDPSYDGIWVYAVRTTGIYCRPSCPARKPLRKNVVFLAPEEAERRGFRACLRCCPDQEDGYPGEEHVGDRAVRRALAYLEEHLDDEVTLARLGNVVGLSPSHLQRCFRDRVGVSPAVYQRGRRVARLRTRLRAGDPVSRAGYAAGFGSSRAVYEHGVEGLGMTPGKYRSGGQGAVVRYALTETPLGRILVGATARGVCAVLLGEDEEELLLELREEFPAARLRPDPDGLAEWTGVVADLAAGGRPAESVPLELRGTAFQLQVWDALRKIPPGETRSYGELAEEVGVPGGARAVGGACARNPAALVVPCHRALRTDGTLGGYRWGPERKQRLLEMEGAGAPPRSADEAGDPTTPPKPR